MGAPFNGRTSLPNLLRHKKEKIKQHRNILAERYGIAIVGIFGSYVRGEQEQCSDIDLLADILRPITLLEIVGAELYLSEVIEIKIDPDHF
jgi:uncharacterized protein